jgi:hypothetical protein
MTDKRRADRPALHPSRPSEADGDSPPVDDDRDAAAAGEFHHPREFFRVVLDVVVGEGDLPIRVVLTGRGRVRSGVLPEDLDALGSHRSPFAEILAPHSLSRSATTPLWQVET